MSDKGCTYKILSEIDERYKNLESIMLRMKESLEFLENTVEKLSDKCYIMNHKLAEYKCQLSNIEKSCKIDTTK